MDRITLSCIENDKGSCLNFWHVTFALHKLTCDLCHFISNTIKRLLQSIAICILYACICDLPLLKRSPIFLNRSIVIKYHLINWYMCEKLTWETHYNYNAYEMKVWVRRREFSNCHCWLTIGPRRHTKSVYPAHLLSRSLYMYFKHLMIVSSWWIIGRATCAFNFLLFLNVIRATKFFIKILLKLGHCTYRFESKSKRLRDVTRFYDKRPYTNKNPKRKATTLKRHQNFDYTTIADRLSTVSLSNDSYPTGVIKQVRYPNIPTNHKSSVIKMTQNSKKYNSTSETIEV